MRIEEISKATVERLSKDELHEMRIRMLQLWRAHFHETLTKKAAGISREVLLEKYGLLYDALELQGGINNPTELDLLIAKNRLHKINATKLGPAVLIKGFLSCIVSDDTVDFFLTKTSPEDLAKRVGFELGEVAQRLDKELGIIKNIHLGDSVPLFDLVLIPSVQNTRRTQKAQQDERAWSEEQRCEVMAVMRHMAKGNVLDVGCQKGMFLELMFRQSIPAAGVTNNDKDLELCDNMGFKVKKFNPTDSIPYENESFDYVTNFHSLDDLPTPGLVVDESIRIAKKKVIFVVTTKSEDPSTELMGMFYDSLTKGVPIDHATAESGMRVHPVHSVPNTYVVVLDVGIIKNRLCGEEKIQKFEFLYKQDANPEQRIVTGVVYEPGVDDTQGDFATAEEIEKAAHSFMENAQTFGINHDGTTLTHVFSDNALAKTLESYIAPIDFAMVCTDGSVRTIKKGSWVLSVRVICEKTWQKIKDGVITGFSMAGQSLVEVV